MTDDFAYERDDFAYERKAACRAYTNHSGRAYIPGVVEKMDLDTLLISNYQKVWLTLEDYKKDRCNYDPETNEWLVWLVTERLLEDDIPPIYLDEVEPGVYALVDGSHRLSAHYIAGRKTIMAHMNINRFEEKS